MRLHITLVVPGRNGSPTQFVYCEHPAASMEEWAELLNEFDHVLVTELNTDRATGDLTPGDEITLHQAHIAKSAPLRPFSSPRR